MAGRREIGGGLGTVADGFQTVDHSMGKSVTGKDRNRKKDLPKKGSSHRGSSRSMGVASPPTRKMKNDYQHRSMGRHSSEQRYSTGGGMEELEYVEKEILTKDRKKSNHVSLSHLLNFTVTPRERNPSFNNGGGNGYRKTRRQSNYNKEQFLLANCQFVVRADSDYSVHVTQSDLLVDWNNVEQVRLSCHEIPSCPVCLYIPTAAKMTRCGHIFCSSCILHYLTLSEKKWRKCPICYESIYKHDLKSVTTFAGKKYQTSDIITMTLMKKKKGHTIVVPSGQWDDSSEDIQLFNDDQSCCFSKLIVANSSQILSSIIEPEKLALQGQLASLTADEESERCFIQAALEDLRIRAEKIVKDDTLEARKTNPPYLSTSDEEGGEKNNSLNDSLESANSEPRSPQNISPRSEYVYFYQATDGQHLYVHPLNGKALVTEFGGWDKCPNVITGRIVEMEQHSMSEDERARNKYLNHLPLTCEFSFCELELTSPLLSMETHAMFNEQFQKRKQRRQKKKREDKRFEKKQGKLQSGAEVFLSSDPADVTPERFHDFLSIASSPPLPSLISSHFSSPTSPWGSNTSTTECSPQQPSFAQALALGDRKTFSHRPVLQSTLFSGNDSGISSSEVLDDCDLDEQSVPSFQNSFSTALLSGDCDMQHSVLVSTENQGKPRGSKAAKKGRKKIVLFSTAGGNHRV